MEVEGEPSAWNMHCVVMPLGTTQSERGIWEHGNPDGIDEVSPGHQMKGDSAKEERIHGILRKLGKCLSMFGQTSS
jgi:hypothetical protein